MGSRHVEHNVANRVGGAFLRWRREQALHVWVLNFELAFGACFV